MKKYLILLFLIATGFSFGQSSVNKYQYVIVPSQFAFQNVKDQYRLNTLTKLLLEKYGFKAYLDSEILPQEVSDYNCNKLYANVESNGSFIRTKVRIVLKDCKNNVLYVSAEGKSKEKDWGRAYNEALRDAGQSLAALQYRYVPEAPMVQKVLETTTIMSENFDNGDSKEILFAQPIKNGYQLVDRTPKVVMKIFKTASPERYAAVKGDLNGELNNRNGVWYFDYFQNDQLISEMVEVKF